MPRDRERSSPVANQKGSTIAARLRTLTGWASVRAAPERALMVCTHPRRRDAGRDRAYRAGAPVQALQESSTTPRRMTPRRSVWARSAPAMALSCGCCAEGLVCCAS